MADLVAKPHNSSLKLHAHTHHSCSYLSCIQIATDQPLFNEVLFLFVMGTATGL